MTSLVNISMNGPWFLAFRRRFLSSDVDLYLCSDFVTFVQTWLHVFSRPDITHRLTGRKTPIYLLTSLCLDLVTFVQMWLLVFRPRYFCSDVVICVQAS